MNELEKLSKHLVEKVSVLKRLVDVNKSFLNQPTKLPKPLQSSYKDLSKSIENENEKLKKDIADYTELIFMIKLLLKD